MIIVDVNLLIYAVNKDAALHRKAKSWLESAISGTETVGLSWTVFTRVPTLDNTTGDISEAFGCGIGVWRR